MRCFARCCGRCRPKIPPSRSGSWTPSVVPPVSASRRSSDLLPAVDALVVVGGKNSRNTRELAEAARARGVRTLQVQSAGRTAPGLVPGPPHGRTDDRDLDARRNHQESAPRTVSPGGRGLLEAICVLFPELQRPVVPCAGSLLLSPSSPGQFSSLRGRNGRSLAGLGMTEGSPPVGSTSALGGLRPWQ